MLYLQFRQNAPVLYIATLALDSAITLDYTNGIMDDFLLKLKQKYLADVRSKEREIETLKLKLAVLEEVSNDVGTIQPSTGATRYEGKTGITDCILDALGQIGGNGGAASGEVVRFLEANGFRPNTKNFRTIVSSTLGRLTQGGRAECVEVEGKRKFKLKP